MSIGRRERKVTAEEARKAIHLVDSKGLVTNIRYESLQEHKRPYAHAAHHLLSAVKSQRIGLYISSSSGCLCVLHIERMEAWRNELQASIAHALQHDEEDDECEEFFLGIATMVRDEVESEVLERPRFGGSRMGRKFLFRVRETYHLNLFQDYFAEKPTYGPVKFRRRFRMRRELFLRIMDAVSAFDPWFVQRRDAAGRLGLSTLQKCTATIRMLGYGLPADACDEYCRLGESTASKCMKRFVVAIRACFGSMYLRQPTRQDLECQMAINKARGFPGMFGSIDCMHWNWKNCPVAWQGQFQDKDKNQSIILEAIADQSLWIWHAFFGLPGGNNDINVLDRSPLVSNMLRGEGRDFSFQVNGHIYPRFYLLADGIYPPWACFVQPIHEPIGEMKEHFTKCQEGARKDVERAFGVLQARLEILKSPVRQWDLQTIEDIMMACIIMLNMIIEDEQGLPLEPFGDWGLPVESLRLPFFLESSKMAQGSLRLSRRILLCGMIW